MMPPLNDLQSRIDRAKLELRSLIDNMCEGVDIARIDIENIIDILEGNK